MCSASVIPPAAPATPAPRIPWWRDAVCYQIYVRSFADGDGDGVGDLAGIASRLPYLAELGLDAIWLTPFYRSPQADHGYDVADYRDVDPLFGSLADFDEMLADAHRRGLKVIVDIVPNHSSDEHAWFQAALAAGPGSAERARYIFRDGRGPDGAQPPNNWESNFGGRAWQQVSDGQWYLHLFDVKQPDFDWSNPEVADEFDRTLRFWLDRGVDGFRVDVAHGLVKAEGLPDLDLTVSDADRAEQADDPALHVRPYWNQPGVHDIYRRWHRVLAEYDGDRMFIGEAWLPRPADVAPYVRSDEMSQCFNFFWLEADWSAKAFREVVDDTFAAVDPVGASPTWVLSNHDVVRAVSRYGDGELGRSRARAAALAMFALPGGAYVYQGEELGLPEVFVPEDARQDPAWLHGRSQGRDGCRVPLPWTTDGPSYGFSSSDAATPSPPWLPQPDGWGALSAQAEQDSATSTLSFFRQALSTRRRLLPGLGDRVELLDLDPDVLAFRRAAHDGHGLVCVLNAGGKPHDVSAFGAPLLVSTAGEPDGWLAPDTAAWFVG